VCDTQPFPYTTLFRSQFREHFGYKKHTFTGGDYIDYYRTLIEEEGAECEVIFSNQPKTILDHTKNVLTCDIHSRALTKRILKDNDVEKLYGVYEILSE